MSSCQELLSILVITVCESAHLLFLRIVHYCLLPLRGIIFVFDLLDVVFQGTHDLDFVRHGNPRTCRSGDWFHIEMA